MMTPAQRAVIMVACMTLPAAPAAAAAEPSIAPVTHSLPFTDADFVLLQTDADGIALTDALGGYSSRAGLYLPVGELARLLDLAIYVDPAKQTASGWIVTETRTFEISLPRNSAKVEGREVKLQPADAVLLDGEMYVRAELAQRLLPFSLVADLGELTLQIRSREELPFKARMSRLNRSNSLNRGLLGTDAIPHAAELDQPYRFFSPPSVDLTLRGELGNRAPHTGGSYDIRLGGDLLYAGFQLFAASDQQGRLDSMRVLFERKDPKGAGIAGPFGLTRFNIGDTQSPGLAMGAESATGRGLFLTSEALEQANIFDRTDLRGELPSGYQVELYVNEVLRGSALNTPDGRYAFTEVPLSYGSNQVRLVFYGPRGERREEARRINVDGNQLAAGKTTFSLGIIEESRQVVEVTPVPEAVRLFLPGFGQTRLVARMSHGLGSGFTVNAGAAHLSPPTGDGRTLFNAGLVASLGGYSTQIDGAWDTNHAHAVALGIAGRLAGVSLVARHTEYGGGFIDEVQPRGAILDTPLQRATTIRSDFGVRFAQRILPLALTIRRDEMAMGRKYLLGSVRSSFAAGGYLISTGIDAQRESGGGEATMSRVGGGTELTRLAGAGWQLRAGVSYEFQPKFELSSANFTADRQLTDRFALRLAAAHYFGPNATTAIQAGLTRRLDFAYLTLNSAYSTATRDLRIGMQVSLGGLFDPFRRRYRLTPPGSGVGGNIVVQAFEDANGSGTRDAGEAAVVGLKVLNTGRTVSTDVNGRALAAALGSGTTGFVEADPESIEDPYLRLDQPRWQFVPRPGKVAIANFVFARGGEVTVRAEFDRGDGVRRGLSALSLRLMNERGEIAFEGRSEFDGSLLAAGLRPGKYRVELDPEQAARLGVSLEESPEITIATSGGYSGQFTVRVIRSPSNREK
ncbi:MAG: hypothetical protein ACK44O_07065 [Novosphingobium sp.]|jgi:hypothetical protein|uniref:hypothetical protein n=1 Tax=Novosphingobium sp. TaxID=1874826 RepID=UPI003918E64F